LSASSSTIESIGVTSAGGPSTIVSQWLLHFMTTAPIFDPTLAGVDILSAGLDASYAISCITIFFVLQYPKNGTISLNTIQNWWGNMVYTNTADYRGVPL